MIGYSPVELICRFTFTSYDCEVNSQRIGSIGVRLQGNEIFLAQSGAPLSSRPQGKPVYFPFEASGGIEIQVEKALLHAGVSMHSGFKPPEYKPGEKRFWEVVIDRLTKMWSTSMYGYPLIKDTYSPVERVTEAARSSMHPRMLSYVDDPDIQIRVAHLNNATANFLRIPLSRDIVATPRRNRMRAAGTRTGGTRTRRVARQNRMPER